MNAEAEKFSKFQVIHDFGEFIAIASNSQDLRDLLSVATIVNAVHDRIELERLKCQLKQLQQQVDAFLAQKGHHGVNSDNKNGPAHLAHNHNAQPKVEHNKSEVCIILSSQ